MQSFLQYRRFGQRLKAQYDQDRSRVYELAGRSNQSSKASKTTDPASEKPQRQPPDAMLSDTGGKGSEDSCNNISKHSPLSAAPLDRGNPTQTDSTPATWRPLEKIGTALGEALTGIEVRKRTTDEGSRGNSVFVVGFQGEKDALNPHNWSAAKRWFATSNIALIGWIVGVASSIDSGALDQATEELGASDVTESLATGLFLVGFGVGALVAGPFSEEFGRNPVYIATLLLYMIWIMASALAPNIGAQLVFRFLGGVFASTPLTCAGGSISDLWSPEERTYAFPLFANAAFSGPVMGPILGSFIGQSHLSWRWCEWVTLLGSAAVLTSVVLFQPETYPPILLKWKAQQLRRLTDDDRFLAQTEVRDVSFGSRVVHALYRPFLLAAQEPIVLLFGLYLTIVYIILFGFLNGFTFVFADTYELSQGLTGLCFVGIIIGLCLASLWVPLIYRKYHRSLNEIQHQAEESGDSTSKHLPPEIRLWFAMLGGPALPISLFWMGWTARPDVSIWAPLGATVLFGYSILCIFVSCYQYLIDSYELYSASALASVTVIRYVAAGGMVEAAIPMYGNLGVKWTSTLLGCLSALMVPVPFLFYRYGERIRKLSKFAATH